MTIEIHQPELEALIQQRMASGNFQDVEEVLIQALKHAPDLTSDPSCKNLVELLEPVRGLFADGELDFSRNPSMSRTVDLA